MHNPVLILGIGSTKNRFSVYHNNNLDQQLRNTETYNFVPF